MSSRYNLLFAGRILYPFTAEQARDNFAGLYKLSDPALLDRIFSGQRVLLQKGLAEDDARQRCQALRAAGLDCEMALVPATPSAAESPAATAASTASGAARAAPAQAPVTDTDTPTVATPPRRLELGDAQPRPMHSHHQESLRLKAIEQAAAPEPRFQIRQDAAVTQLDPRQTAWDPHFFPDVARGLCWGGFFAPFLWGTFNGLRLSFVPALGVRFLHAWVPAWAWILFYLAFGGYYLIYGREMAWEHKSWRNAEHFNRVQRYWTWGSLAIFVLSMYGLAHLAWKQHESARFVAATEQYESALRTAAQIRDAGERAAATGKARETYLGAVGDPALRSQLQQEFHEEDAEESAREKEGLPADSGAPESGSETAEPATDNSSQ